jgi:Flp pilus assembly protein TadD
MLARDSHIHSLQTYWANDTMARRRRARPTPTPTEELSAEQALVHRARRHRRRGEHRQAMLALRKACNHQMGDPRLWTQYAVACVRVRRFEDAERALGQALWLRERARDAARARVTRQLMEQLREGERGLPLRAA